jgi:hypothetical protein
VRTRPWRWLPWLLLGLHTCLAAQSPVRLAVLKFEDDAGFQGDWELSEDVPRMLAASLRSLAPLDVVEVDSAFAAQAQEKKEGGNDHDKAIRTGRRLGVDYVVLGTVAACGVRRTTAGDPNLAGYKAYTYRLELADVELLRVSSKELVRTLSVERDSVDRPLELNLFGRPGKLDKEFRALFEVAFNSPEFQELTFGRFASQCISDLAHDVISTIYDRPPLQLTREGARVLAVEDSYVYLGIGVEDGLATDDVLPLLDEAGNRVAVVSVEEVIGAHLSKARIERSTGTIETGFRIGQRLVPDDWFREHSTE